MTDGDSEWLAERFEASREHLRKVAYRMLGSRAEAEDAVQEAWLRLTRADAAQIENLDGWLTTVVARVCLDQLRSRKARGEEGVAEIRPAQTAGPEEEVQLADSIGIALLVVLETLTPAERVAFVLHNLFDLPFDEIAPIVGRSPTAARQLASRARRRVQGSRPTGEADRNRQREIVDAFLAAARGGDFAGLLALLDPDVVLRADAVAARMGADAEVHGAQAVAQTFAGRARVAQLALIDGAPGAVWAPGGEPRVAFAFTIENGTIVGIDLLADPERLSKMNLNIL